VLAVINKCPEENTAKPLDGRSKQQLKNIDILEKIMLNAAWNIYVGKPLLSKIILTTFSWHRLIYKHD
jgi:hypothetical protein